MRGKSAVSRFWERDDFVSPASNFEPDFFGIFGEVSAYIIIQDPGENCAFLFCTR